MTSIVDIQQRIRATWPALWVAGGLSLMLLVYGNGVSSIEPDTRERFLLWSNLSFLALLLTVAVARVRLTWQELGLQSTALLRSAAAGAALSAVAIVPVAFIALAPLVTGEPVEAEEITGRSGAEMAYFLGFRQPIGTAVFEEVAFRGVLYGAWQRVGGYRTAIIASAAVFAAWHLVITSRTVGNSGVVSAPPAVVLGVIASLAGLFVGGLIFAYLRWRTGSVAAAAVAHWLVVAAMSLAVWSVG